MRILADGHLQLFVCGIKEGGWPGGGGGALTYMASTGMCRSKDPHFLT